MPVTKPTYPPVRVNGYRYTYLRHATVIDGDTPTSTVILAALTPGAPSLIALSPTDWETALREAQLAAQRRTHTDLSNKSLSPTTSLPIAAPLVPPPAPTQRPAFGTGRPRRHPTIDPALLLTPPDAHNQLAVSRHRLGKALHPTHRRHKWDRAEVGPLRWGWWMTGALLWVLPLLCTPALPATAMTWVIAGFAGTACLWRAVH